MNRWISPGDFALVVVIAILAVSCRVGQWLEVEMERAKCQEVAGDR